MSLVDPPAADGMVVAARHDDGVVADDSRVGQPAGDESPDDVSGAPAAAAPRPDAERDAVVDPSPGAPFHAAVRAARLSLMKVVPAHTLVA